MMATHSQSGTVASLFDEIAPTWGQRYSQVRDITDYELVRRRELALASLARDLSRPDALVIEVGCGAGDVIAALVAAHPGWQGVGLDISEGMIAHCHEVYQQRHDLLFLQHDITRSPANFKAGAVVALGVVGYLGDFEQALQHIAVMLEPGGYFIFTINKPSLPWWLTSAYRRLRELVRQEFHQHNLNRAQTLRSATAALAAEFLVLETFDYTYLPYVPVLRRWMWAERLLEKILGRRPTPLSSTTLLVTQKRATRE